MSPERFNEPDKVKEYGLTDRIRDSLIESSPEHADLIRGRDAVVTAYCEARGISKDDIGIEQLLEIRATPEWQNPFGTEPPQQ